MDEFIPEGSGIQPMEYGSSTRRRIGGRLPIGTETRAAIAEAVRKELLQVLDVPIEKLGVEQLSALVQIAEAARPFLADHAPLNPKRVPQMVVGESLSAYAPSPAAETFGARLVRELVAAIPAIVNRPPSAAELVSALGEAKRLGLDKLASDLEAQLTGAEESAP